MEFPGMFGFGIFAMIMIFSLIGALITVIPFWKICDRVGLAPPLSLLMLVPLANLILPFYIAFARWPADENKPGQGV